MVARKSSEDLRYAVWPTAWGPMGAAAGSGGLCRLVLPHYQADDILDLLSWEHPGAVRCERPFERLIALSLAYFRGEPVDFSEIECDLPGERTFSGRVYRACRKIQYGQTRSYSRLAMEIGREDAARAVAAAMGKNPVPLVVPCHRVTYADGRPGGFSAAGGETLKRRMLDSEKTRRDERR
ncbi:MAG: methylated-DNA--[protein]-cysteine S-methyltransferase [Planctomycetota bacterium]|nr:methylated-DNA--[protein]-cysteine S-methyltransferase [Planctomycetota bacterium]